MSRCADILRKQAALRKTAGVGTEVVGTMFDPFSVMSLPAGYLSGASRRETVENADKSTSLLPIVGSYRLGRRIGRTSDDFKRDRESAGRPSKMWGEVLGPSTSMLTAGLLGAGIGAGTGALGPGGEELSRGQRALLGALAGGTTGMTLGGLANFLAPGAAAVTDTRDEDAQRRYETGSGVSNWLVPGAARYNLFKRLGYSRAYDDEARELKDKDYEGENLEREARMKMLQKILDETPHDINDPDPEALRAATMLGVLRAGQTAS